MARKRKKSSRKKKTDVSFVVTKPKSPDRLKLPEPFLFPVESCLPNLSFPTRIMSILIAAICVAVSIAMTVLAARIEAWPLALPSPFGIWYGIAWLQVAHEGYLPGGRLRLNPWARK
jgi:hypothetical protein